MKLHQLFYNLGSLASKNVETSVLETEVSSICFDARQVTAGSVFIAVKGQETDGHSFIEQAINNGAIALIVENKSKIPSTYKNLVVEVANTREVLDLVAARFYGDPSLELFCFGVTGTNGKTSITYILEHIFSYHQQKLGVIGTVNHRVAEKIWPTVMTTPDAITTQSRLRDFVNESAVAAAIEVSSHALQQRRVHAIHFNTVIFTNLTLDHLDYHKNMENYFAAKQKLFTDLMWLTVKKPKFAVINIDDDYGRKLKVAEDVFAWTYGQRESDFQFKIIQMSFDETEFELKTVMEKKKFKLPITGKHTVYNMVAASVAALSAGFSLEQSFQALKQFAGVPGRLQKVETQNGKLCFIDYAHTPDAIENVLNSLIEIRKQMAISAQQSKVICVFGCGGDRDKTKRPLMGKIAIEKSDFVYITSDNPRTENPESIIADIKKGIDASYGNYQIVVDREQAIASAIARAQVGDVVLIAGKGHEDYQIIGTEKYHFSDYEVAQKYLNG